MIRRPILQGNDGWIFKILKMGDGELTNKILAEKFLLRQGFWQSLGKGWARVW